MVSVLSAVVRDPLLGSGAPPATGETMYHRWSQITREVIDARYDLHRLQTIGL
jgi:hypothetical protein